MKKGRILYKRRDAYVRVFQHFFMLPLIKYNPLHRTIFARAEKDRTEHDFILFVFFFLF